MVGHWSSSTNVVIDGWKWMAIYMDEIKSQLKASLAQHLAATNVVIDGETLRARVRAAEIQGRLEDMVRWCHH